MTDIPRKTARLAAECMKGFLPPDDITVSEWAARKRRLSAESSAEVGPWRNARTPYLIEPMNAFNDPKVNHIVIWAASQVGKALSIDTPLVTPDGWTTMGEVRPGDRLYDENGNTCTVVFATEVMNDRPCYKLTFSDGSEITADAEHRWYLRSRETSEEGILTTKEISMRPETFSVPEVKGGTLGKRIGSRDIIGIETVESVPVKCIQVDSPSHLYLAGKSMIPTHNTESELNIVGYIIDEDPGSILFIHPTNVDARDFSKLRISPMIRDCTALRTKVADPKQRDSANTILQKSYPGGILTLCGSTEAHALASKPIRYVIGDERDRWATSAGNEGDPWELAMARQTTFYNAKAIEVSTPTVKGASAIESAYAGGTMEIWESQCPECGGYAEIKWQNIRFEYDTDMISGRKTFTITKISYACPECGSIISEYDMKKAAGRWTATNPDAYASGCRSFRINAFVSQWMPWEKIILKYLKAQNDTRKLQVVYNTLFGELWEDRGDVQDEDTYLAKKEDYGRAEDGSMVELPEGVLVLTMGVDTQDDRLEYEVKGFGHFMENWGIERGVIMGRPDSEDVWTRLDDVIDRVYHFRDGKGLKISLTFVDEGGHFTQEVREHCRDRITKHVFAIKGIPGMNRPYTSPPKKITIKGKNGRASSCWQYQIGVDAGKQLIMDGLRVQTPGPRYCHFPKKDEYGARYFNGLLSEHLEYDASKKQPWQWKIIPGHERNETLDISNYALAAFKSLNVNLDAIDRRLKEVRGQRTALPEQPAQKPKTQPAVRKHQSHSYFDSW